MLRTLIVLGRVTVTVQAAELCAFRQCSIQGCALSQVCWSRPSLFSPINASSIAPWTICILDRCNVAKLCESNSVLLLRRRQFRLAEQVRDGRFHESILDALSESPRSSRASWYHLVGRRVIGHCSFLVWEYDADSGAQALHWSPPMVRGSAPGIWNPMSRVSERGENARHSPIARGSRRSVACSRRQ